MELILTHENADFDAVAAQLAAHILHPAAVPLLSRRVNRNVIQFLNLYWDALPYMRASEWRRRRLDRVILVDTQSVPNVRGLKPNTPVHVYDHHQPSDLPAEWTHQIEAVGATTSLLTERLQASGIALPTEAATLLLLGIYEDTGALTYDTTTARDAQAAAWLLDQGALLNVVRRYLDVPLSAEQQAIYDALQANTRWLTVEEQSIAITSTEAPPDFEDEISAIAHRLRDALNPAALFILVGLRHHVQLVARSSTDAVDVAIIARALGGGGHGRAAAATVLDLTLTEVTERIEALLTAAVQPVTVVASIMSQGVQTINAGETVAAAAQRMQRSGHEGYPVVDGKKGRLVGLLTRRAVDRAMSHNLGNMPVRQIMRAGTVTIQPEDSTNHLRRLMIETGWGQIPVVADGDGPPIGIVTRTDVLNLLSGRDELPLEEPNWQRQLAAALPAPLWSLVTAVAEAAVAVNMPLYFVGGLVRDLMLHRPASDLDFVVEGNAIRLARHLQRTLGGETRSHRRFGTAKWLLDAAAWDQIAPGAGSDLPDSIDFATARTEYYARPSALPEVENSSIKLDLHRRDFTINTLAIRLDGAHMGELLDFYNGRRDLRERRIRVLHSLSFIDDPTRILRAVRFAQRFDFEIEGRTLELIESSLSMLDRVTGERIKNELEHIMLEARPALSLRRLAEMGVLAQIQAGLTWPEPAGLAFTRLRQRLTEPRWQACLDGEPPASLYFALWLIAHPPAVQKGVMERLHVRKSTRDEVNAVQLLLEQLNALPDDARPSQVHSVLHPYQRQQRVFPAVLAAIERPRGAGWLTHYWDEWQHVRPIVSGDDLRAIGLPPGPHYRDILDQILWARLDGTVNSEAEERALLAEILARAGFE